MVATVLHDPRRLAAVERAYTATSVADSVFDRLARLAADLLEVPIALVCLVGTDRQVFLGAHGLSESVAATRQTPIDHSICQYAVATGRPLIVTDTRNHPDLAKHPAVTEYRVTAYAGIPLVTAENYTLGTMCVMDTVPRDWTDDQLAFLAYLARIIIEETPDGQTTRAGLSGCQKTSAPNRQNPDTTNVQYHRPAP